jgi:hypothetical protein
LRRKANPLLSAELESCVPLEETSTEKHQDRSLTGETKINIMRLKQNILRRIYDNTVAIGRRLYRLRNDSDQEIVKIQRLVPDIYGSGLFDREWYLTKYPDVAEAAIDPAIHYLKYGWREGRDPSLYFSTSGYLNLNRDVAITNANPLVHFLEYGRSEGRSGYALAPIIYAQTTHEFPPAAPCFSLKRELDAPVRWKRQTQLDGCVGDLFSIGDMPVGYLTDEAVGTAILSDFLRLRLLCGSLDADVADYPSRVAKSKTPFQAIDAWFAGQGIFRARWYNQSPFIVRAYQADPHQVETLRMIGESLITSSLDTADFWLVNPFFPVLFVFTAPQGQLLGSKMLAFPSLARGGFHYAELLQYVEADANHSVGPIDIFIYTETLAEKLTAILHGRVRPLVANIQIDLSGADGTHQIFQPDLKKWLRDVMRVGMAAAIPDDPEDLAIQHLVDAVRVTATFRTDGASMLELASDMIPAISLLTAPAKAEERGQGTGSRALPMIVVRTDPSLPATHFSAPASGQGGAEISSPERPIVFPRISAAPVPGNFPSTAAAAIRRVGPWMPTEAEILFPVAPSIPLSKSSGSRKEVTLLLWSDMWEAELLPLALQALSLQSCADGIALAMIGDTPTGLQKAAERYLPGRHATYASEQAALVAIRTDLVGYLGPNVILHDHRCLTFLNGLMTDTCIASAACIIASCGKHGKGWMAAPTDTGKIAVSEDIDELQETAQQVHDTLLLWKSTYPIYRPPRDLWITRKAFFQQVFESNISLMDSAEAYHLCTSVVTASYGGERSTASAPIALPDVTPGLAVRSKALVG